MDDSIDGIREAEGLPTLGALYAPKYITRLYDSLILTTLVSVAPSVATTRRKKVEQPTSGRQDFGTQG